MYSFQNKRVVIACILIVLVGRGMFAQSKLDSLQQLPEVVVTAKTFKEVIPAQKLTGEELESLNSFSVADAIRYFAGVQIKDYGGIGGLKTVNIRSMGTNHMGVFYDGIQLGNAQNGQIDLGKFSLDNIEEISLYNGQKSQIFQSAKDFGSAGSIYLTTRKPRFKEGKETNYKLSLKTGSFGLLNPSVLFEHRLTDKISTSLNAEWVNANGKYDFRYRRKNVLGEIAYDTTAIRKNSDINATRMELGFQGEIPAGVWNVRAYNYNSERGMPGAIVNNVWRRGERLWDTNSFLQGTIKKEFLPNFKSMANIKYAFDFTHYINNDDKLIRVDNTYRQREFYFSTSHLFTIVKNWDISFAYDFQWNKLNTRNEAVDSTVYDFPFPSRFTQLASLATAFEFEHIKCQASILGNFVINKVERHYKAPNKTAFSPAVFLSYQPFKTFDFNFRSFFKKSFRMPTFNDLYYTDMGNSNLRPEYVTQYDIGVWYETNRKNHFLSHFKLSVDGYYNEVKDKIVAYPKGQQFRWTMLNLGYVEIRGIDAIMQLGMSPIKGLNVLGKLQYTYQKAQDLTHIANNYYAHQIPYIPWHSGSAILNATYKDWGLNYSFIYVGERYNQQENIRYNHTQPWYTSDISVLKYVTIRNYKIKLSGEINNLLSQDYDVILNYPMPKRNYKISMNIEF